MKIKQWIDRNWNLRFNKKKCYKLILDRPNVFKYNEIIINSEKVKSRCLGKDWYKLI